MCTRKDRVSHAGPTRFACLYARATRAACPATLPLLFVNILAPYGHLPAVFLFKLGLVRKEQFSFNLP